MPIPLRQNPVKIVREWRAARRLRAGFVWLTPQLVQGPMFASEQSVLVSRMGIESVLDLREPDGHDASMLAEANLHYYHYPMPEFDPPTLAQLEEGVRWSLTEMAAGRTVLVHCRLGVSRSPLMACAILVRTGHQVSQAITDVMKARPGAQLTEEQLECLQAFENAGGRAS